MDTVPLTLSQAQQIRTDALLWIGLIIVVTVLGGFFIMLMRRRLLAPDQPSHESAGLMDTLRGMRDRGEISQVEFEAARRSLIDKAMARKAAPEPGTGPAKRPGGLP